jgi:hypothetical protein
MTMKKIILPAIFLLGLAVAGCQEGDYGDEAAEPQTNEQDELISVTSTLDVTPLDTIYLEEFRGDSVQVGTLGSISLPSGAAIGSYRLNLGDGNYVDLTDELKASAADLQDVVETVYGTDTLMREFTANISADIDCGDQIMYAATEDYTLDIMPFAILGDHWSLIGVNGDWNNDIDMTEVAPGIWMSPQTSITSAGWKVRNNHGWDENAGGALTEVGEFSEAVPGGDNINLTGDLIVVYNANNGTLGTLSWGIVGSIASIDGFNWNADLPMNLASDGKFYSVPVSFVTTDEFKIRKDAAWNDDRGGTCTAADEEFDAVAGGSNLKVPADGVYMVVYDPSRDMAGTQVASGALGGKVDNNMLVKAISVEAQQQNNTSVLSVYKRFSRLRNTYPALATGTMSEHDTYNSSSSFKTIACWYMTSTDGSQKLLVVHNVATSGTQTLEFEDDLSNPVAVLGSATSLKNSDGTWTLNMGPNSSLVFQIK